MYEVLARYYAILYLVFAKWKSDLGKGLSMSVYEEFPIVRHFIRVFGVDSVNRYQREAFNILEENVDELRSHVRRKHFLEVFEEENERNILNAIIELIKERSSVRSLKEASKALKYSARLFNTLQFIDEIKYGRGILVEKTVSHGTSLVEPLNKQATMYLDTLADTGLAIHLPAIDCCYTVEELKKSDHYIVPSVLFNRMLQSGIRELLENNVNKNHKVIQEAIKEIGEIVGYDARSEYRIELPGPILDVVWIKGNKITKVFEVQMDLERRKALGALHNLKKAYEVFRSELYLVVPNDIQELEWIRELAKDLGIGERVKIITTDTVILLRRALEHDRGLLLLVR
ncbi:MAG: hypothetical protein GSR85_05850 [Desulfurococcales archaeon]|nr:hypothetical protein [Desulfurococcales archaeon]